MGQSTVAPLRPTTDVSDRSSDERPVLSRLTRGIRTGIGTDPAEGAIVPPLYLSSNFSFAEFGTPRRYDYT
ncbi:MAG TPA: hypothetical protein VIC62_08390, partial [Nakamurella sp.]